MKKDKESQSDKIIPTPEENKIEPVAEKVEEKKTDKKQRQTFGQVLRRLILAILRLIETLKQRRTKFDCYWIDAGWYGAAHETEEYQSLKTEDWFFHVGDWRPNAMVHPNGLKPISDAAHAAGMKFLLWFEVERAIESSPWVQAHPDWYFGKRNTSMVAGRSCSRSQSP